MSMTSSLPAALSSYWQRWFVYALAFFFIVLSIQYSCKILDPRGHRSAIERWRQQLVAMDAGENIYHQYNYPNPPIMAILLSPFAHLPSLVGSLCWFYLKVGMALVSLHWVFRLVEQAEIPFPAWAKAVTVLLSLRPIMGDLLHGNVNIFILFLVVAALYAFHRRRDWSAGLWLALAISCKVTPVLFIPYFIWKRAWKTLGGCTLGLILFLFLIPGLRLGWRQNLDDLTSWTQNMVLPYVVGGVVTSEHNNQSLPGLVFRLLTHSPSFSVYIHDQYTPVRYDNLLSLDPRLARWAIKGCMGIFALLIVWVCRTPTLPRRQWRLAAEFSIVILGMLLFSERTWKHHCVTLLLPFAVLCYYLATVRMGWWLRSYLVGSLVAVTLLIATTSTSLLDDDMAKMAQAYGAYVWGYLILTAALAVILRCKEEWIPTNAEMVSSTSFSSFQPSEIIQQRLVCLVEPNHPRDCSGSLSPFDRLSY